MDTETHNELAELCSAFVDGTLDEQDNERLQVLLSDNPEAKKYFVRFIDQHRTAQDYASTSARIPVVETKRVGAFRKIKLFAGAAAVLLIAVIPGLTFLKGEPVPPPSWSSSTDTVTLTRTGRSSAEPGLFPGDRISVDNGAGASFSYPDGTSVTLLPGTEIKVLETGKKKSLRLGNGALSIIASKQPESAPMKIVTDQAEISVVGTVFNVRVSSGTTRISVVEGTVRVMSRTGDVFKLVSEGQHALLQSNGSFSVSSTETDGFKGFINGSMSNGTDVPLGWNDPYIVKMNGDKGLVTVRDRDVFLKGPSSVRLSTTGKPAEGNTYQVLDGASGKKLRITGFVKHRGKGKRYWAIAVHSFSAFGKPRENLLWEDLIHGVSDTDWTYFEGTVSIPAEAGETFLRIFMKGEGSTWLDEVSVTEVKR